jgi:hypothetical protein
MSPEVALLSESWEIVKPHIPSKDRLHVAESLLRIFDETLDINEIHLYKNEFDKVMKTAIVTYYDDEGLDDVDEDEDGEWY